MEKKKTYHLHKNIWFIVNDSNNANLVVITSAVELYTSIWNRNSFILELKASHFLWDKSSSKLLSSAEILLNSEEKNHLCHLFWNETMKPDKMIHTWLMAAVGYKHSCPRVLEDPGGGMKRYIHQIHPFPHVWGCGWSSEPSAADTTAPCEPTSQTGSVPTKKSHPQSMAPGPW